MGNSWTPECIVTEEWARTLVENQFPQLHPIHISMLGTGFDNTVFEVNEKYVFRFPRREVAVELIETENRLLPKLRFQLPIPIPNPVFFGKPGDNYPWTFTGYEKVEGHTPTTLSVSSRLKSVKPLAQFIKQLHAFPILEAKALGVPFDQMERLNVEKRRPKLIANLNQIHDLGLLPNSCHNELLTFIGTIKGKDNGQYKSLVHGDFHIRNLLVDGEEMLSGVIDWGDVHIGDPAVDLSIAYSFIPPEGRELFFQIYGEVDHYTKQLAQFKAIYTTALLLVYGLDKQDDPLVRDCSEILQHVLSE